MLSGKPRSRVAAAFRGCLLAAVLAIPATAQAQSFMLPQPCRQSGLASGNEGFDPVVILVDNFTTQPALNFTLLQISGPPTIEWGITISPFRGGQAGYTIFTSYTPFLTSTTLVSEPGNEPSKNVLLPRAGDVVVGRKTAVYPTYELTIRNKSQSQILPYAYVDFIPDFVGSSPLTIQADASGKIMLYCVQQNFQGYNITVYDQNHAYLYDGSFAASGQGLAAEAEGAAPDGPMQGSTRPHPDEPE
jgi:hypothetical protein